MNCIVVDDDEISRAEAEHLIGKVSFLNLVKSFSNAFEAFDFISHQPVDLIFLDVMMPGMTGLEFIQSLNKSSTQVILMTVERKFAADAFEFDVTDFLVKPISSERFLKVVAKARKNLESTGAKVSADYVFAKVNGVIVRIDINSILFVEAVGDYVCIQTTSERYLVHTTMRLMESKLPDSDFIRVHKSYIVRIDRIKEIESGTLTIQGKIIPISASYRKQLLDKLMII